VNEITAIGEDVVLDGTSRGSVLVVGGDVTLGPHARALDGVTVLGGRLQAAPTARIDGDLLQVATGLPHPSAWVLAIAAAAALLVRSALALLLVRLARLLAGWSGAPTMLAAARTRPLRTAAVGALLSAGLLAGTVLLALSLVGLVVAAALVAVLLVASAVGIGFAFLGDEHGDRQRTVTLALLVPVVGDALAALAAIAGLGAGLHYLLDERGTRRASVTSP
jgi:hypothetical protein